ncbi:MAG: NAD(P)/FAD-dependent oxidoreductase [Chloroflexota bacterium]
MKPDYLIVGSGLAALSFGALMANAGQRVQIIEAHYLPGGYGHTFELGGYKFNAQLHYVWNCGEGRTVHSVLKRLGLAEKVLFHEYDANGFDRMRMPGFALDIPYDYHLLIQRLQSLFPQHSHNLHRFVHTIRNMSEAIDQLPGVTWSDLANPRTLQGVLSHAAQIPMLLRYQRATLQEVFDDFKLPSAAQTLLALQWPDFMLPPNQLSFIAWLMLFTGYCRGAYYPARHFEDVINGFVGVIEQNGGEILYEQRAVEFVRQGKRIVKVRTEDLQNRGTIYEHEAPTIICNMDPRQAAEQIGFEYFSSNLQSQLNYEYSYSNFMVYAVVKGIDLQDYGFGRSNLFHTEEPDLNKAFDTMHLQGDYSRPSFAVTVPSLLTNDRSDCPPDHQIIEFLTVANYSRFLDLKLSSPTAYRKKKAEIARSILDVMEAHYVPDLRKHMVFQITGSPTTNERYCWSPAGNSYGSNMTPKNIGRGRLTHESSLDNFYFCNASSGYAGFAGTIWTGCRLYEKLSGDVVL